MAVLRYIVPALAVAGGAAAQFGSVASSCSASGTSTIQSQADATALASCKTFTGSIAISSSTAEPIDLTGIEIISGDLVADNVTQMTQLSAGTLAVIGGAFRLTDLSNLNTLNFPDLVKVSSISWIGLPNLGSLNFAQGVQQLQSLDIENTFLSSLEGINLEMADTITIVNNLYLKSISMQLGNVSTSLVIGSNSNELSLDLPNLIWANNLTVRGIAEFSTPSLSSVNGSMGVYTSTFSSYSAPNLTNVGGALSFVSNNQLSNISLPELTTIGGALFLVNDSSLASIEGFPNLKTIGGNVLVVGAFDNFTLPSIGNVRGSFNLTSTQDLNSTCHTFDSMHSLNGGVIKGTYHCAGSNPNAESGNSSSSGSGSGSGSGGKSAASSVLIPGVSSILAIVAVFFGLL